MPPLSKQEDDRVSELASELSRSKNRAHFRPTAAQKELAIRAAALEGQSLSEFMRIAIEERAKRIIADHEQLRLNGKAREIFLNALANPAKPNDRLTALSERYAREVKSRP